MDGIKRATLFRDAADVMRYHTKRTLRQQTVGAHSFNMLLLLDQVHPHARKEVFLAVMHHDLPELFTGDMPAPMKRMNPQLSVAMSEAEEEMLPLYRDLHLTVAEERLVKWLDNCELTLWCLEECELGNRRIDVVLRDGITSILAIPSPTDQQIKIINDIQARACTLGAWESPYPAFKETV